MSKSLKKIVTTTVTSLSLLALAACSAGEKASDDTV